MLKFLCGFGFVAVWAFIIGLNVAWISFLVWAIYTVVTKYAAT